MFVYTLDTFIITDLPCNRVLLTVHTGHPHQATGPVHLVLTTCLSKHLTLIYYCSVLTSSSSASPGSEHCSLLARSRIIWCRCDLSTFNQYQLFSSSILPSSLRGIKSIYFFYKKNINILKAFEMFSCLMRPKLRQNLYLFPNVCWIKACIRFVDS